MLAFCNCRPFYYLKFIFVVLFLTYFVGTLALMIFSLIFTTKTSQEDNFGRIITMDESIVKVTARNVV